MTMTEISADGTAQQGGDPNGTDAQPTGTPGQTFTVKVNGTDQTVTLEEMQAGYMRQADYTRKTTDVANQRKELEKAVVLSEALEKDPRRTLETIAAHYGVNAPVAAPQRAAVDYGDDNLGEPENVDPNMQALQAEVDRLNSQLSSVATTQQMGKIDQELAALESQYGTIDRETLLRHASVNNLPIATAYRDLHFEEAQSALTAQKERQAAEQAVVEQKRQQAGVVSSGVGAAAGSVGEPSGGGEMSLMDALKSTMSELGVERLDDPLLWG